MKRRYPVTKKPGEQGFALLIVFLMAAAIALMLYQQMPRVAFESERDKEQLLVDRGEEFKRSIYLYAQDNKHYPARLEDLESTNNKRYLRKRYIDPFTGKNEWRLVHTNGALLTDSLVQKPPTADGKSGDLNASLGNGNSSSSTGTGTATDVNVAVLQRPSDRTLPTGIPGQGGFPTQPGDPNQFQQNPQFPPISLSPIGPNGQPTPQGNGLPGNPQFPFNPVDPNQLGQLQQQQNGLPPGQFQPGQLQPGQFQPGGGLPNGQFQTGQPFPGQNPQLSGLPGGAPATNAASIINGLLTQPRQPPSGLGGFVGGGGGTAWQSGQTYQSGASIVVGNQTYTSNHDNNTGNDPTTSPSDWTLQPNNGTTVQNSGLGPGIAGVASTYKAPSIKAYNKRTKFQEWEFIYQPQQQKPPGP
jgi:hypothetical protein